jgi:hypothetical protein
MPLAPVKKSNIQKYFKTFGINLKKYKKYIFFNIKFTLIIVSLTNAH